MNVAIGIGVAALVIISIFADRRYRGSQRRDEQPTAEVFRDPASGRITRVYSDAAGRRAYRDEQPSAET